MAPSQTQPLEAALLTARAAHRAKAERVRLMTCALAYSEIDRFSSSRAKVHREGSHREGFESPRTHGTLVFVQY